ncbi:hypothetical protein GIB67_014684 [Kingdonia uniflora]|uniref:Serine decarboxylase n=1 Tax=Kingdonia uniflora TaxID=39325 RepID=A0A7J7LY73_9MAGN|nr:hypothetical protein GIB67_014684 [Kingdonia uniflora]
MNIGATLQIAVLKAIFMEYWSVFPDGILYASRESHYSVFKAARMYKMECIKVNTLVSGEINCEDFRTKLVLNKDKPAILNVNIGTMVKGAVGDLDLVIKTLEETGFAHDLFYIQCDGALFRLMMSFVKRITRLEHINALSRNVEYLASRDATIMGSRNGHAPIFFWYTLNRKGYRGFQKEVQKCLRNAHYLKDRLKAEGIGAMLIELSSTVVFGHPQDEEFVRRWQLACQGNIAHVVVMPNITIEKLDDFMDELIEKRPTWFKDGKSQCPCIAADVGKESCACSLHKQG